MSSTSKKSPQHISGEISGASHKGDFERVANSVEFTKVVKSNSPEYTSMTASLDSLKGRAASSEGHVKNVTIHAAAEKGSPEFDKMAAKGSGWTQTPQKFSSMANGELIKAASSTHSQARAYANSLGDGFEGNRTVWEARFIIERLRGHAPF